MTAAKVRIGRVKMKAGGADVHILPPSRLSDAGQSVIAAARFAAEYRADDITGYAVAVWSSYGGITVRTKVYGGPFAEVVIPEMIAAVLRDTMRDDDR